MCPTKPERLIAKCPRWERLRPMRKPSPAGQENYIQQCLPKFFDQAPSTKKFFSSHPYIYNHTI